MTVAMRTRQNFERNVILFLYTYLLLTLVSHTNSETIHNGGEKRALGVSSNLVKIRAKGAQRWSRDYYFGEEPVTFNRARDKCRESKLNLLVVDTSAEQAIVSQFLEDDTQYNGYQGYIWTAGTYDRTKKIYQWSVRPGVTQPMHYMNFDSGLTTCDGTRVAISNENDEYFGRWYLVERDMKYPFICET